MDQVLAETNLGYMNSGVALRVQRFCLELATINDTQLSLSFLNKFQAMKVGPVLAPRVTCHVSPHQGSVVTLRNSADAAHLFADKFASCGVAYIHSVRAKLTLSISRKSCALGGSLHCACAVTDLPEQDTTPSGTSWRTTWAGTTTPPPAPTPSTATATATSSRAATAPSSPTAPPATGERRCRAQCPVCRRRTRVNHYSNPGVAFSSNTASTGLASGQGCHINAEHYRVSSKTVCTCSFFVNCAFHAGPIIK